ncbi:hypothetical protein [Thiothrix lacustris]|uniref:hypothetical protein n=1 Tax=Thiothrix lacustris TaxID=525917 RepID=UPI0027E446A4|nr:hypothetical protein [Thiothrix lacustris]WMP16956.1 hypothetical protein RCS87_16480 [Thiothrix lacustris]
MKLNSNTTPNGTNSTFQHGMSKQECEQLAKIQEKLNIYSALVGVVLSALERHQLDETAAIELVLNDLSYNLAYQSEMIEKMIKEADLNSVTEIKGGKS